ncbi:MAG: PTS sugar transporter subunit IIA [Longicatena sp.]|jgi:mannose PTS system EIIA component|uniref:PTS sugar transporter subunit IIA n=1 Tax=Anaerorhabdus sp. TaxID=1872524 RepID=UPI002FCBE702
MCKLLLISHGDLSSEMLNTAKMIFGETKNVSTLSLPYGKDLDLYEKEIEDSILSAKSEGILILTDLFGGSPFMTTARIYGRLQDQVPTQMVTGMNLGMVLQVMSMMNTTTLDELAKIALESGLAGIVDFKDKVDL